MTEQSRTDYADPTALLLPLGKLGDYRPEAWLDYSARFGFGQEHVPDLIRMAAEPFLNTEAGEPEIGAPIHAWRTLG